MPVAPAGRRPVVLPASSTTTSSPALPPRTTFSPPADHYEAGTAAVASSTQVIFSTKPLSTLAGPITREMACLSRIGSHLSDQQLRLINASPSLTSWLTRYDAEVKKGTHLPIDMGGEYRAPAGLGTATLVPGQLMVSSDALVLSSDPGAVVVHLAHELKHYVDWPTLMGPESEKLSTIRDDPTLTREQKAAIIRQLSLDVESSAYLGEQAVADEVRASTGQSGEAVDVLSGYYRGPAEEARRLAHQRLGPNATPAELELAAARALSETFIGHLPSRAAEAEKWVALTLGP